MLRSEPSRTIRLSDFVAVSVNPVTRVRSCFQLGRERQTVVSKNEVRADSPEFP